MNSAVPTPPEREERPPKESTPARSRLLHTGVLWAWLPVLLWMALILTLSSQSNLPARTNAQTGETIRTTYTAAKLAHVAEYSVLGLLLLRAFASPRGGLGLQLWVAITASVLVAGLFGGLDELRQSFVPNREPRLSDIALDTASALAAVMIVALWLRIRQLRKGGMSSSPDTPSEQVAKDPAPTSPPLPRQGAGFGS
jgi:VanZ family protein